MAGDSLALGAVVSLFQVSDEIFLGHTFRAARHDLTPNELKLTHLDATVAPVRGESGTPHSSESVRGAWPYAATGATGRLCGVVQRTARVLRYADGSGGGTVAAEAGDFFAGRKPIPRQTSMASQKIQKAGLRKSWKFTHWCHDSAHDV